MLEKQHTVRLYPWYVYGIVGYFLSPFVPWMLVTHALWVTSYRKAAALAAALNVGAAAVIFLFCQFCSFEWWIFYWALSVVNAGWSVCAGVYQRAHLGPAAPFLKRAFSRHLAGHALFSVLFACCLGLTISLFAMVFSGAALKHAMGLDRDRKSVV
jgi:hypothetical protein